MITYQNTVWLVNLIFCSTHTISIMPCEMLCMGYLMSLAILYVHFLCIIWCKVADMSWLMGLITQLKYYSTDVHTDMRNIEWMDGLIDGQVLRWVLQRQLLPVHYFPRFLKIMKAWVAWWISHGSGHGTAAAATVPWPDPYSYWKSGNGAKLWWHLWNINVNQWASAN